jgi:hypothetical protein
MHQGGRLGWETPIPDAWFDGQSIVDQESTTYVAGVLQGEDTAWL